jgi:hypothetical protein
MRRICSSPPYFLFASILYLTASAVAVGAQTDEGAKAEAGVDTAVAEAQEDTSVAAPGKGRLRISIDESGISVEGEPGDAGSDKWVEIRDDRGPYREKGVDIVKFGKSVFVAKDEMVRGDLVVFGGNAIIEGRVTGNVFVIGGNIRLRSGAEVKGDVMIIGGVLDEDDDVIIHGERILFDDIMPEISLGGLWGHNTWFHWVFLPVLFFVKLVLAFLVLLFLRDRVVVGNDHLSSNVVKSFGAGVLTTVIGMFALLIIMIPLVITVIGIPLAILLVVSCCGIFIIAWTVFAFTLGRLVVDRFAVQSGSGFLFVFVGVVVLFLPDIIAYGIGASPVPILRPLGLSMKVLGILLGVVAYMSGLGSLVVSRFGSRPLVAPTATPQAPTGGIS